MPCSHLYKQRGGEGGPQPLPVRGAGCRNAGCQERGRGGSCRPRCRKHPGQDAALPEGRKSTEQRSREDPSSGLFPQWLSPCRGGHTAEWAAWGREIRAGDGSNNPGNHDQNLLSDKGAATRHHN